MAGPVSELILVDFRQFLDAMTPANHCTAYGFCLMGYHNSSALLFSKSPLIDHRQFDFFNLNCHTDYPEQ